MLLRIKKTFRFDDKNFSKGESRELGNDEADTLIKSGLAVEIKKNDPYTIKVKKDYPGGRRRRR
jgi:hypothetical protein